MTGDGVYITIDELKTYGLNGDTATTPDDGMLAQAIAWAEQRFDQLCGVSFDQASQTLVQAFTPFIDVYGWLHLFAREKCPVTAVSAVQMLDMTAPTRGWQALTIDQNMLVLPPGGDPPHSDALHVSLYVGLSPASTGQLRVKWSYTGGYSPIPVSLKSIITRMAWWHYKLREAPLGRVVTGIGGMGVMEIPAGLPADVEADIDLWSPNYS